MSGGRRRTPGQRAGLTRDSLAAAALAMADSVGPERFSVRALARHLGVDPSAVYYWYPARDDLFDAMTERALDDVDHDDIDPDGPWDGVVEELARRFYRGMVTHPAIVAHVSTRAPATPHVVRALDTMLGALRRTGMRDVEVAANYQALMNFVFATALTAVARAGLTPDQIAAARARSAAVFAQLDPGAAPHARALVPLAITRTPDERFETGLRLLVDGLRAAVPGHRPPPPPSP